MLEFGFDTVLANNLKHLGGMPSGPVAFFEILKITRRNGLKFKSRFIRLKIQIGFWQWLQFDKV